MRKSTFLKSLVLSVMLLVCGVLKSQQLELSVQSGHTDKVNHLVFSKNSRFLASSGNDKKTIVWDLSSNKQLLSLITESASNNIFFLNQDSVIVTVENTKISLWDIASSDLLHEIFGPVTNAFESQDGNLAIVTSGMLQLINPHSGKQINLRSLTAPFSFALPVKNELLLIHDTYNAGYSVPYTADQDIARPSNYNGSKLEINSLIGTGFRTVLKSHPSINRIYYLSGNILQSSNIGNQINYNKYFKPFTLSATGWGEYFTSMAVSQNFLFAGSRKGFIYTYNSVSGKQYKTLNLHTEQVNCVAISTNEKYFASSSSNEIVLWDMEDKKPIHFFKSMSQPVSCFTLGAGSRKIVTGSATGELKIWDMETNDIRTAEIPISQNKKAKGHTAYINNVEFVNDSVIKMNVVIGNRQHYLVTSATTYSGVWHVNSNNIELNPIQQYNFTSYTIENKKRSVFHSKDNYSVAAYGTGLSWKNFTLNKAHKDEITCLQIDEDHDMLYSSSADGVIKTWNLKTGHELLTLLSFKTNYFYKTSENYYYASKGSLKNVAFKSALKLYPFDQFDLQYNRPEKVISLQPFFTDQQQALFSNAYKKRLKRLGVKETEVISDFSSAPYVVLKQPENKSTSDKFLNIQVAAVDTTDSRIKSVHVLLNGSEIIKQNFDNHKVECQFKLELSDDQNLIQVYAINDKGFSSIKEDITVHHSSQQKQNLYVLAIGSSMFSEQGHELKYAKKDAADIAATFGKNKRYNKVITKSIYNENVTKENVLKEIDELKNISVNDKVILFFAGHGLLDEDLNYYLSTYNVNFQKPSENGLNYDTLINALEKIPARDKIVFLDACHSGELDKEDVIKTNVTDTVNKEGLVFRSVSGTVSFKENAVGLKNSLEVSKILFSDLRQNNGVSVISSAGGAEYAIEGEKWNNGVFTYCLLYGLKNNECDLNKDKKVFMDELQKYLLYKVKLVSGGLQTPTSRSENIYHNVRIK